MFRGDRGGLSGGKEVEHRGPEAVSGVLAWEANRSDDFKWI